MAYVAHALSNACWLRLDHTKDDGGKQVQERDSDTAVFMGHFLHGRITLEARIGSRRRRCPSPSRKGFCKRHTYARHACSFSCVATSTAPSSSAGRFRMWGVLLVVSNPVRPALQYK